jgi:hypothetical protein
MLNEEYLKNDNIEAIKKLYNSNKKVKQILLQSIFSKDTIKYLQKKIKRIKYKNDTQIMSHSYSISDPPEELMQLLNSKEMIKLLTTITGKNIKLIHIKNYLFEWKNYILLHDKKQEKPGIDIIIDFTESWNKEYGGSIVYKDATGTAYTIPHSPNTMIIIERKENVQKFIQYINNKAKKKKRYLAIGKLEISS